MEIIQVDINQDYSDAIARAVEVLTAGGTIVYPTDTLYGLAANAMNVAAIQRVFAIKRRSTSKPLPIMVRNMIWAKELANISSRQEGILNKIWPGKVTAVLEKKPILPDTLTSGHKTVGMRIADYVLTDKLLGKFGYPITATSANISNEEPSTNIDLIIERFSREHFQPDLILDAGRLAMSDPSAIVDLISDKPKILRIGASRPDRLLRLLTGL